MMADSQRHFSEIMNTAAASMDTEEDDDEKSKIYKEPMRRNLLTVFEKSASSEFNDERMSVFLRIRPFSNQNIGSEENQGCVEVLNDYMVTAVAPKDSHAFKAQLYGLKKARHNFTFSRVFPESTSQKEFFDNTMLKLVQDFIEGQNCLVFTYGVTNSGKTYTIQGNPREAGILPRGLDVLFNSISGKQWPRMNLKPNLFCDVVKLSPEEEEKEHKIKERILKLNSSEDFDVMTLLGDDASDQSVMNATGESDVANLKGSSDSQKGLMEEIENRIREETAVDVSMQGQIRFSVWVSFAEIYNEQIFDLLEPMPKTKDAKRPVLKLTEDKRGSPFIKGLKEINVTSADEAYKLLTIGQRNLKTACTRLNHCSSRSHCIFNIKIIRVQDKGNPNMARVSMLSLCDLAGSERHSKTHTTGEHLKEAGNINTSLLTLGRCIELLRYNQMHKDKENKIIPFRDSRLTRLFQNFFCGRGKASMIVNVSQCASMFDETLNVFKFSAIAKQVAMLHKPVEKVAESKSNQCSIKGRIIRASSICWDTAVTPSQHHHSRLTGEVVLGEDTEEDSDDDSTYAELLENRVEELEKKIKEMKRERLTREVQIRREVCREMQEQFVKIEDMYSTLLKETRQEEADRFEKRMQLVRECSEPQPVKRLRLDEQSAANSLKTIMVDDDDEWVSSLLLHQEKVKVQEHEASLAEARGRITALEFQVANLTRKNKELVEAVTQAKQDQKQHVQSSDDLGNTLLLETLGQQLQEAKSRLKEQEKEIGDLNEMLTDAGNTFHQKEEEIARLKQVIAEDEERAQQQVAVIQELRALLEESKAAMEDSEKRLEAKNRSISEMKDELSQLEVHFKEESEVFSTNCDLKKCAEELAITRNRLKYEKEDFQQREKALIHGYTAEINNLKSQMALLRSQNLGKCAATLPVKGVTPEKTKSPVKFRRRKPDGRVGAKGQKKKGTDMTENLQADLVKHLQDLQMELRQAGVTKELQQKIGEVWHTVEELQQQVACKKEVEARLQQSQLDLQELQREFEELSAASTELQRQLTNKKELQKEITDNQSESAELRQKLRIAKSSADDLETRLTMVSQQKLTAEASRSEVMTELKNTKARLEEIEVKQKNCESRLADACNTIAFTNDRNAHLQEECDSYKITLDSHSTKMEAIAEEKNELLEKVKSLEEQLNECMSELCRVKEKNEELETVVTELRTMLQQTAEDSESKTEEVKKLMKQVEDCDKSAISNENLLKTALSEANDLLQEKTQQCENLNKQITNLKSCETDLKSTIERQVKELAFQTQKIENLVKEVSSLKSDTSAALLESQNRIEQLENVHSQTEKSESQIKRLQCEAQALEESYERRVHELESKNEELQSTIDKNSASKNSELEERENQLKNMSLNLETVEKSVQERDKIIEELKTKSQSTEVFLAEQEKLLIELKASKIETEKNMMDVKEKFKVSEEEKEKSLEQIRELQEKVTGANQHITKLQQELDDLRISNKFLEDTLAEQKSFRLEIEKELEAKKQFLEDLKQKESVHLQKLQSLEKAQKETKKLKEKKLAEVMEDLKGKNKEVDDLNETIAKLQEENSQSGVHLAKLNEMTMEIADLRSKLHMEETLKDRHKYSAETLKEEKAELEKHLDAKSQELDELQKEKSNLLEEANVLKMKVSTVETSAEETYQKLNKELMECQISNRLLTAELEQIRHSKKNFEASEEKFQEEKIVLENKIRELEERERRLIESSRELKTELEAAKSGLAVFEQGKAGPEQNISASQTKPELNGEINSKQDEDLISQLETEKSINRELHEHIKALASIDTVSDAPGSSRRLRKEKIQAESELVNVRFQMEKLKKQVEKLLNTKDTTASTCHNCCSSKMKLETSNTGSTDKLTQELGKKSQPLQEPQAVLEFKAKLLNAKTEAEEMQTSLCETKKPEPKLIQPVSIPSEQQESCSRLDSELTKWHGLSMVKSESMCYSQEELEQRLTKLTSELEAKDQQLQEKKQHLTNLQAELNRAQQQKKIVMEDVKANELVIQQLKDAMIMQDETMEKQDAVISQKDEEILSLTAELERLSDRYQLLLTRDSDGSRELRSLTCQQVLLEEEKKQLSRELSTALEEKAKLLQDLTAAKAEVEASSIRLKVTEEKLQQELSEVEASSMRLKVTEEGWKKLQQELSELSEVNRKYYLVTSRYKEAEKEKENIAEQLKKAMKEKQQVEENLAQKEEEFKVTIAKEEKTSESTRALLAAAEKELAKVKKAYEKDTKTYLVQEDHNKKLKETVQCLEKEIKELEEKYKKGEEEKKVWLEQRDVIVTQMETLLSKQSEENESLKSQQAEDKERYEQLLDQERREKRELKKELKILQRAKDSLIMDLRHSNYQLQVELALAQGLEPPPCPPPPHGSFRVNESDLIDDIDTTGHLEIDATPIAAKSVHKGRKRKSTLNSTESVGGSKSRRKPCRKQNMSFETLPEILESTEKDKMSSRLMELENKVQQSPLTRSAKKILRLISPEQKKMDQESAQVLEETRSKRGRKKANKSDAPSSLDCSLFQSSGTEVRMSSRIRERRQTSKLQSNV